MHPSHQIEADDRAPKSSRSDTSCKGSAEALRKSQNSKEGSTDKLSTRFSDVVILRSASGSKDVAAARAASPRRRSHNTARGCW